MNSIVVILLFVFSILTLAGVVFVAVVLWRIPRKCPQCGKRMEIASIQLICKKCGFVESTVHQE